MCASCGIATHVPLAAPRAEAPRDGVAFAALRHTDFRWLFGTTLLAMMADNVEHVISYWVLFEVFHSPQLGGFAVISHWLPFLLLSVSFGALTDRFDCRRITQIAQAMYMAVSAAWGILFLTGSLEMWHAVVLLTVHGLAGTLWAPASQLILYDIAGPKELQSAVRLNATARSLGILLGPAVGAGLMLALGPAWGILANVLIYLPLTVWLQLVPYTGHQREGIGTGRGRGLGLGDALRTLQSVSNNRTLISMLVLSGVGSLLVGNAFQAQMPEFARDFGTDQAGIAYGALLTANAAGAVVGGVLLESAGILRSSARMAVITSVLWAACILGFAFVQNYAVALVLLFFTGVFNLATAAMAQTLVQLLAPPQQRGRVIGVFNMAQQGLRVGSGVTVGVLGGYVGVHWSLGGSALLLLGATLFLLATTRDDTAAFEGVRV